VIVNSALIIQIGLIPYFPDYKSISRIFSCHGGGLTYTPVWPICRQIHQHASSPRSETIGLLTDSFIPVSCVERTEPCVMQAADQVTVGWWGIWSEQRYQVRTNGAIVLGGGNATGLFLHAGRGEQQRCW